MPELPDVEVYRRFLEENALDRTVATVSVRPDGMRMGISGKTLRRSGRPNAVRYGAEVGAMPATWLLPNREDGADCPRCGGTLRRTTVSGRGTYVCDRHQARWVRPDDDRSRVSHWRPGSAPPLGRTALPPEIPCAFGGSPGVLHLGETRLIGSNEERA